MTIVSQKLQLVIAMPKLLNARTSAVADEPDSLSRVERKRRDARDRIIRQAESLMRNQPIDDIT
ncbi:MAG: hypothetical protein NZ789_08025, partial [Pseudomonadales bacterium]|nr:hypothetical protein [Pseudomonadales bacterium]